MRLKQRLGRGRTVVAGEWGQLQAPEDVARDMEALRRALEEGRHRPSRLPQVVARFASKVIAVADRLGLRRVQCPVCGHKAFSYRPDVAGGVVVWNSRCAGCRAAARHRLFAVVVDASASRGDVGLHLAPERWLAEPVAALVETVLTLDIERAKVHVHADAQMLPFRDESVDLIVCSDVLEHIPDDALALDEFRRVLSSEGQAVIHVPVLVTKTLEYGYPDPLQHHHYRAYGPDVRDRFTAAGFSVTTSLAMGIGKRERRSAGLKVGDALFQLDRLPVS